MIEVAIALFDIIGFIVTLLIATAISWLILSQILKMWRRIKGKKEDNRQRWKIKTKKKREIIDMR